MKKITTLLALALCLNGKAQCPITLNGASNPSQFYDVMCNGISTANINASGATGYTWTPSSSLNVNTGSVVVASPTVTTIYTITATTGTCTSNSSFTVYVYNTPSAPVLSGSNPVMACQGTPLTLSVTPASGTSVVVWYNGSTFLYNYGNTYSPTTNVVGTTIYSVIDSAYYCPNSSPLTITVTVNPTPSVTANATANPACNGNTDTLLANGAITYTWTPSTYLFSTTGYSVEAIGIPTVYTVTGSNSGGCTSTATVALNVIPSPTVSFNLVQDIAPHTWDVYPSYSSNVNFARWHWGDGTATVGLYPSHTYTTAGRYNINVLVYACPTDSSYFFQSDTVYRLGNNSPYSNMVYVNVLSNTTGIQQVTSSNEVSIYPNPSNGSFVMEPNNNAKQTIQVYDVNGKMVLSQTINCKTTIDASTLNEGVYNISIISNEGVTNKRLVIVR
ncbi:MAG TPA: T9SS type A sorting domain-containing protein [Bacteroidia bacterium]